MSTQPKQRAYIVLQQNDFACLADWYALLESLNIPFGEETNFVAPETVELWTTKVEATS